MVSESQLVSLYILIPQEDGNVYGWNVYYDGKAKYFDSNFTRLPRDAFNGTVVSLGGKYGGRFAVTS